MTPSQRRLLEKIREREPERCSYRFLVNHGFGKALRDLIDDGMVISEVGSDDRRKVMLTPLGRAALSERD